MATESAYIDLMPGGAQGGPLGKLKSIYRAQERNIVGFSCFFSFLVLWEFLGQNQLLINTLFTSFPSKILLKFWEVFFITQEIYVHIVASFQLLLIGFFLAAIAGILGGMILGRIRILDHIFSPFVDLLYSAPHVAFLPLFIIWLGVGMMPKVLLVWMSAVFPILYNTYAGVKNTDPKHIEAASSYGAKEKDIFFKIVLPAAAPFLLAAARLGLGRAIIGVMVAEFFASSIGIGWLIANSGETFRIPK
ncbi:MAG: ABC transporter permease subunit, partial [Dehalococcoidia bacterium]|nr:ABC transporter permease subunit [Dehalococcoidia bacterium]